jgi:hypothetical protein
MGLEFEVLKARAKEELVRLAELREERGRGAGECLGRCYDTQRAFPLVTGMVLGGYGPYAGTVSSVSRPALTG